MHVSLHGVEIEHDRVSEAAWRGTGGQLQKSGCRWPVSSVAARLCLVCYGSPGGGILWLIAIHECSGLVDGCHHLGGRGLMDHVSGTSDAVQSALLAIDVQSGRLPLEVNYPVIFAAMA